jgi:hypothetical protein
MEQIEHTCLPSDPSKCFLGIEEHVQYRLRLASAATILQSMPSQDLIAFIQMSDMVRIAIATLVVSDFQCVDIVYVDKCLLHQSLLLHRY